MNRVTPIIIVVSLVLASCSWRPDPWRREDTYRHIVLTGLMVVDWQQTREVTKNPEKYRELNPILGEHPSGRTVDLYMAASYVTKTGIAYMLPETWRKRWQWLCIGSSGAFVIHNYSVGLKGEW